MFKKIAFAMIVLIFSSIFAFANPLRFPPRLQPTPSLCMGTKFLLQFIKQNNMQLLTFGSHPENKISMLFGNHKNQFMMVGMDNKANVACVFHLFDAEQPLKLPKPKTESS
jgi:hypothetical protein